MLAGIDPGTIGALIIATGGLGTALLALFGTNRQTHVAELTAADRTALDRAAELNEQSDRLTRNLSAEVARKEERIAALEAEVIRLSEGLATCRRGEARMEERIQEVSRALAAAQHRIETLTEAPT
jgi:chromosome segregation ATPase